MSRARFLLLALGGAASPGCSVLAEGELAELPATVDAVSSSSSGAPQGSSCEMWTGDCNGDRADGCESDLLTSAADCGECGHACDLAHAIGACKGAVCRVDSCEPGWADCNGVVADGCEVHVTTDVDHCGACDAACAREHAVGSCEAGACAISACEAPFADCDGDPDDGCETDTSTDAKHCGGCGEPCSDTNAATTCAAGACAVVCAPAWGDCNVDASDGCETKLVDNGDHCGGCGVACSAVNGVGVCAGTTCAVSGCSEPWADCDGAYATGCEANLTTSAATCGSCAIACSGANGSPSCKSGACEITCLPGHGDCDGLAANGCEATLATDPAHCGACDTACLGGRTCGAGSCDPPWLVMSTVGAPAMRSRAAATWIGGAMFLWGGHGESGALDDGALYHPDADEWTVVTSAGAPSPRVLAGAVWTGSRVVVWGGGPITPGPPFGNGKRWVPALDQWSPMSNAGAPSPRRNPIVVWTGARVVVWGGVDGPNPAPDGAMYDDANDAWTPISSVDAPSPRTGAAFAWSGTDLLVFGGRIDGTTATSEGHAFDPAKNEWRTLPALGAPSPRFDAFGQMTPMGFVVWGGRDQAGDAVAGGGIYVASSDSWTAFPAIAGAPSKRSAPSRRTGWSAWTGDLLLLFGGVDVGIQHDGKDFDPFAPSWLDPPGWPSTTDHEWGASVWTGAELILWSGLDGGALVPIGERYQP